MSSRSNSSNQSKGTHLPLQKRVFNAPLAAVIAMGCVTGIAGGIAATSAHPMQAAYAASGTTQGVFTLDRAADGMDRSANAIVKAPCFFIDNDNQFHDYDNFEWKKINKGAYIKDLKDHYLAPYYGLTDTMDISYNQGSGVFTIHKNGVEYTQTLAEMFGNYVKLTRLEDVGKKVIGPSVDDPNVQNKIKTAFIEANKDLRIIDPSELYFTTYCYYNEDTGQTEKDRVFAYVSKSGRTIDSRTSVPQIVHDYYICGIKRVFEAGDSEPAPLSPTLTTTELAEDQKVEVADPAQPDKFTSEQLNAIKDALNKVNAKVDTKDAVSAVKYEASKLVAVLSDNTTKVELDAAKLTKKKVVVAPAHTLKMPETKATIKDYTVIGDTEKNIIKQALIKVNSWLTEDNIKIDMSGKITVTLGDNKTQEVKLTDICDATLELKLPNPKVEISNLDTPSQDDQQKIIEALIKANEQSATSITKDNISFSDKSIKVAKQVEDYSGNKGWARKTLTVSDVAVLKSAAPLSLTTTELAEDQKVEVADPAQPDKFTSEQLNAIKDALNKVNAKVDTKDAVSAVKYEASKLVAVLSDNTTKVELDAAKLTKKKVVSELKTLTVADPELTEVAHLTNLSDTDVAAVKKAIKDKNTTLDLTDEEIAVEKTTGKVTITRAGFKPVVLEANKVVKQKPAELQTLNVADPAVTEVVNTAQIQDDEVTKIKTAIKAVNQSLNLQDSEITVEKTTGKVTITRAGFKPVVLEANKVVTKKVVTPIEPPAPEPPAKESPREILKRTNPAMFVEQSRYAGKTALDTMAKIVEQAFPSAENVVLATQYGYWDALSANALAGSLNAPIMLSDFDSLPEQTVAQLKRLQAKTVYICGGTHVISKQVEQQLHQLGMRVVRYAGSEASDTATKIALNTETVSDTCFITTSWGYGDSMSVSSYSYAKHAPIFLTNMNGDIDDSTLDAIRAKGFKHIVLVGGTSVISAEVEDLVRSLGVSVERVWGETQYDTSLAFAKWATQDSKEPLTIGISTGYGFTDALCGAALTGKAGGVMVLADDSMTKQAFSAFKDFVGTHAKQIEDLQIFGGTSVVGMGVTQALTSEFKEAYQNDNASAAPEGTSTPTQPQGTAGQTQPPLRREN